MTLSPAFLAWQRQIEEKAEQQGLQQGLQRGEQQGLQQGLQQGQQLIVESLLRARFGELDDTLSGIVPVLLSLPAEDYAQILLQLPNLSRQELLDRLHP